MEGHVPARYVATTELDIRDVRKDEVLQVADRLGLEVYRLTGQFPKSDSHPRQSGSRGQ